MEGLLGRSDRKETFMTPLFRWVMFFSSYIPLLLVLCVLLIDRQPVWMLNVFSFTHIVSWASTGIFFCTLLLFALMMSYYFIVLKRRPGELRPAESIQARDRGVSTVGTKSWNREEKGASFLHFER